MSDYERARRRRRAKKGRSVSMKNRAAWAGSRLRREARRQTAPESNGRVTRPLEPSPGLYPKLVEQECEGLS